VSHKVSKALAEIRKKKKAVKKQSRYHYSLFSELIRVPVQPVAPCSLWNNCETAAQKKNIMFLFLNQFNFFDPRFGEQEEILEQNKQVVAMLEELNRYDFLSSFPLFTCGMDIWYPGLSSSSL
jgi:hypothetical protein